MAQPIEAFDPHVAEHAYTAHARERLVHEAAKSASRTDFERDRARVLHSSALRRLGAKTQVLGPGSDDFVRTRLTHSLEVAQVGRELGEALGCDPDVVDAACLAHDLGHPPFGHNGEAALARVASDIGGFEGNAQTLRLLTRLEPKVIDRHTGRSAGLNLTRAGLDAATKYPWALGEGPRGAGSSKFGVYADDRHVFDWMRGDAPAGRRCIEAQVMDFSDDVAYSVHDVEDAVVAGSLDLALLSDPTERAGVVATTRAWYSPPVDDAELDEALIRLQGLSAWVGEFDGSWRTLAALKDMTSQLIGRFCNAAEQATRELYGPGQLTRYAADVVVPAGTAAEIAVLKGIAAQYVMGPRSADPSFGHQQEIIEELVEVLTAGGHEALEPQFAGEWQEAADDAACRRVVIDQVASLTDVSAMTWHRSLTARR